MKKVLATLAAVALLGAFVLAVAALAGATPGSSQSSKADRVLFALLKGRNEISATTGQKGAGDPDGRGGFTALVEDNKVCFGLVAADIATPTLAHIHRGKPSENGPIVVTLIAPATGASSGCVAPDGGNTAVLAEILKRPNHFYANVHNAEFPGGAIRGQLKHRR